MIEAHCASADFYESVENVKICDVCDVRLVCVVFCRPFFIFKCSTAFVFAPSPLCTVHILQAASLHVSCGIRLLCYGCAAGERDLKMI